MGNPFKPTAGKMPPILIGRDDIIETFSEALENGAGAPGRLMVITGQRGFGKTVMLTELGKLAQSQRWVVISETASSGLTQRIVDALDEKPPWLLGAEIAPSVTVPGLLDARLGSARVGMPAPNALTLREAIERRLRKIKDGRGILITVDETQAAQRDDLVAIATAVQHAIRDEDMRDVPDDKKRGIAIVLAGLPSIIDDVLNDEVLTFLRRSVQRSLDPLPILEVRDALTQSIRDSGKAVSQENALAAAKATRGYPYLTQLVGYYAWQSAKKDASDEVTPSNIEQGIKDAVLAFGDAACAPILANLSTSERRFANALAHLQTEDSPVKMSDVTKRLGVAPSTAAKYRKRLEHAQIICTPEFGKIAFTSPYMAEYLRVVG